MGNDYCFLLGCLLMALMKQDGYLGGATWYGMIWKLVSAAMVCSYLGGANRVIGFAAMPASKNRGFSQIWDGKHVTDKMLEMYSVPLPSLPQVDIEVITKSLHCNTGDKCISIWFSENCTLYIDISMKATEWNAPRKCRFKLEVKLRQDGICLYMRKPLSSLIKKMSSSSSCVSAA